MSILVVEDSASARKMICHILTSAGFEVQEAGDGETALERLKNETFDLVTLDVSMPGINGFEICKSLREFELDSDSEVLTPIVFVTASDTLNQRMLGFEAGGTDFLPKSQIGEKLVLRVQELLHQNRRFMGKRAMVIDDSPSSRNFIKLCLQECGVEAVCFESALKALESLVGEEADKIDLIMTDLNMPGMNGIDFTKRLRRQLGYSDIPIIFVTANHNPEEVFKVFKAGATDYLVKPFIKEELVARMLIHIENAITQENLRRISNDLRVTLAEKQKFLAACSHDFRSPLTGIVALCDFNLEEEEFNVDREVVQSIRESANDLLSMSEELVQLASDAIRSDRLQLVQLELSEILKSLALTHRRVAELKQLTFVTEIEKECYSMLDRSALVRIINNLISNAIKFTAKGGAITVTLKSDDNNVEISIKDTGIGISPEHIQEVFRPLNRASRQGTAGEKSIGLGLSIVKKLVESQFGQLSVESQLGEGSTFKISFPVEKQVSSPLPKAS